MKNRIHFNNLLIFKSQFYILKNLTMYKFFKKFYGFSETKSLQIIKFLGINKYTKIKEIKNLNINFLFNLIKKNFFKDYLKIKTLSLLRIKEMNTFFSQRHINKYPVNGQRARTHGKTRKKFFIE